MIASTPRRLHPTRRSEVGGTEAHSLYPGTGRGDLLDVRDTQRGLEDRVHENRP